MGNLKNVFLILRLPSELKEKVVKEAQKVGLSISEYVRRVIEKALP